MNRISLVVARLWWLREEREAMKLWWWRETALLLYGLILDSGETTCYKHTTSITSCYTTTETYTNTSELTLAISNCVVNNMQTSVFVYLSQVISSSWYWTVLSHIFLISCRSDISWYLQFLFLYTFLFFIRTCWTGFISQRLCFPRRSWKDCWLKECVRWNYNFLLVDISISICHEKAKSVMQII